MIKIIKKKYEKDISRNQESSSTENQGNNGSFRFWSEIWKYAVPYRKTLIITLICSIVTGITIAIQPMIIKFIVDEGINRQGASLDKKLQYALVFCGFYAILSLLRISSWTIGYRRMVSTLEGIIFSLRSNLFKHVQDMCVSFHEEVSSGELFNYIMGSPVNTLKMFFQQFAMGVPYQLISLCIATVTLFYFDWLMTIIFLITICIIITVNDRSRKKVRSLSSEFMKTESSVSKYVADLLQGARAIKIYAVEEEITEKFENQIGAIRSKGIAVTTRQQLESIKPEAIQYIGMSIIYGVGAYSCIYRNMSIGTFFAFIGSVNNVMGPMMSMLQLNLIKGNAEAGLERITRILNTEKTTPEVSRSQSMDVVMEEKKARELGKPCIEFENVEFSYSENKIFQNLSGSIKYGTSTALVGGSGSGKSTFAKLLLRFYDPQGGIIRLNGVDLRNYSLHDLRSSFGVVPQDPFLFQTTIYENIKIAKPDASFGEIKKAMETACVTDFLSKLPNGYNTQVGESGYGLSGGQKQRIAIARAVLGNPKYLIFDEATSALDNQSEHRIQTSMESLMKDHTVIIIAHRLSTIRNVDNILVFDDGKIIQQGNYQELATCEGAFKNLLKWTIK